MENLCNSKGPVERCFCDGSIDKRREHDVVHVRGFARISLVQEMIQEFLNGKEGTQQTRLSVFLEQPCRLPLPLERALLNEGLAENHRAKRRLRT